jgi:hypothetical protein
MTTRLIAPAETVWRGPGSWECWANPGEQLFDREQMTIRNLAADRDQIVLVSGVEE